MTWTHPTSLWALLLVLVALGLIAWAVWQQRQAVRRFGDPELVARLGRGDRFRYARYSLFLGALLLIVLALSGPRLGTTTTEADHSGLDLVVALDVSHSMLAEDVSPSRLERSRHEILRLVEALPGDRVGLVLFAGDAFLQCPLTTDRNTIRLFLDAADPSMIPTPGSDLSALGPAVFDALEQSSSGPHRARVLLVVSDGEFHTGDADALRAELREEGITTLALGVGEPDGAPIPESGDASDYRQDREGEVVLTRLEEASLQELASDGGYVRVGRSENSAERLLEALQGLERAEIDLDTREVPVERFQWPLALALVLLLTERLLPLSRTRSSS